VRKPRAVFKLSRALRCLVVGIAAVGLLPLATASASPASSWAIVSTPNVSGAAFNWLYSASCSDSTDCWAVGSFYYQPNFTQPLAEQWNGSQWSIVSAPSAGTSSSLQSVACITTSDCWAVGYYSPSGSNASGPYNPLVEQYAKGTWSFVSSPAPVGTNSVFTSVTCIANDCWAVGYSWISGGSDRTLIEQNTGGGWSIVGSPNISTTNSNSLVSGSCVAVNDCWAVGSSNVAGEQAFMEHFDGTSWSIVTNPSGLAGQTWLTGVACASLIDCWSVGASEVSGVPAQTLIEHYDGSSWSITTSPNTGTNQVNVLQGVACNSTGQCVTGGYDSGSAADQTLIEQYDGTSWSIVGSPDTAMTSNNVLLGVTCAASECWSAGYTSSTSNTNYQTLVEQYAPPTTVVDDTSPSVTFDSWKGNLDPTADGGTYRSSPTKGATATFKFSGAGISWVTRKGPSQGIATVTIDGKSKGNVDLYATTSQSFSESYSGLTSKNHTIVIKVTGTKDASSGNTNVAVDAFIVGLTTTQEFSPKVAFDSWTGGTSASASGGTYRIDGKARATSSVAFTGTGVTWVTATGPAEGKASVTIDGIGKGTIDLYAPTVHWEVAESFTGLASGTHTIVITVLGTKDAGSAGTRVVVDAFVIMSSATWSTTGAMTTGRLDQTATLLQNGSVLVAGGDGGSGTPVALTSAELYQPSTGTWSATGSMATARALHTATLLPSGQVLVVGGIGGVSPLSSAELYDPVAGTWSATGAMAVPRFGQTATLLPNGQVLIAGGNAANTNIGAVASAELYDPATGLWSATGSMTIARSFHTATLLPNGLVLVSGGIGSDGLTVATAELYDTATGLWSATGGMADARTGHTATLLSNGLVLVAGGYTFSSTPLASAELYDPTTGLWSATGSMMTGRYFQRATLLPNDQVLAAGGLTAGGALSSAELYDPVSGTWSTAASMAAARYVDTATLLQSGQVLVAGGHGSTLCCGAPGLASSELYG
jgi:hypothetical protein